MRYRVRVIAVLTLATMMVATVLFFVLSPEDPSSIAQLASRFDAQGKLSLGEIDIRSESIHESEEKLTLRNACLTIPRGNESSEPRRLTADEIQISLNSTSTHYEIYIPELVEFDGNRAQRLLDVRLTIGSELP